MSTPAGTAPGEFHYRVDRAAAGLFPGAHRSRQGESGFEFRGHVPLPQARDARRVDLLASLRDPFGQWQVRVHAQRGTVPVWLLADLSASMGFEGVRSKLETLADLAAAVARSAHRHGDGFGFIGADASLRTDLLRPCTRQRGIGYELAATLRGLSFGTGSARDAGGLLEAHRWLGRRRALVFVASDFHLPDRLVRALFDSLSGHQVVPVVLWDAAEFSLPAPAAAWLGQLLWPLVDPETGRTRLVWGRRATREHWASLAQRRREALRDLCAPHRLRPVFLEHGFDADALNAHFLGG
ncbi:DUF58 domain-containing protein [Rivibacter subsaxonicus]|uniref:Uncharacterized protein DUF58 n=1 Tax=Rivibacter subsaxonicus TaxID=457575 RepID=A0A4Q7VB19_9BURK|nr:DUF58 domain-containing protein [Rivibacter subsaxonicus]RZT93815.1 uncharacterized protein DUF58 [Rivibacter subsaxonicus]